MATYLCTLQDLEDFVRGCTLLGVGGGGNPAEGLKALKEQVAGGKRVGWVDVSELPDDGWAACTFLMGSTAPLTEEKRLQMKELGLINWRYERNLPIALCELEAYTQKTVDVLVPFELGGSNTPVPIAGAASLGKLVVDGDYAGRAVPEITQTTASVMGLPFCPVASVDKWGNISIIKETISYTLAERIGKFISDAAFGSTGLAGFLVPISEMKRALIAGTLTRALSVGRSIRLARERGEDPAAALEREHGFRVLFRGRVCEKSWKDMDGYYLGTHLLESDETGNTHTFRVFFKNENHLTWLDGTLYVTSPDLIMNMDPDTGEPVLNDRIDVGTRLVLLGARCHPKLREQPMLSVLGPTYFGVQSEYRPIEDVLGGLS